VCCSACDQGQSAGGGGNALSALRSVDCMLQLFGLNAGALISLPCVLNCALMPASLVGFELRRISYSAALQAELDVPSTTTSHFNSLVCVCVLALCTQTPARRRRTYLSCACDCC
jgi:hypothetical protein